MKLLLFSLDSLFLKENIVYGIERIEDFFKAFKQHEQIFESISREDSLEYQEREAHFLLMMSEINIFEGNLNLALDYSIKSLSLIEEVDPQSYFITHILVSMGNAYTAKGELNLALKYIEKALSLTPEGESFGLTLRRVMIYRILGSIYFQKGELDRALKYFKRDFEISKKYNSNVGMCAGYHNIIEILLHKKDLTQAQSYLQQFKQLNEKLKLKETKAIFQVSLALVLKLSSRIRDHVEAETILKKIIETNIRLDGKRNFTLSFLKFYFFKSILVLTSIQGLFYLQFCHEQERYRPHIRTQDIYF